MTDGGFQTIAKLDNVPLGGSAPFPGEPPGQGVGFPSTGAISSATMALNVR